MLSGPMADADAAWLAERARDALATTFRAVGLDAAEHNSSIIVAGGFRLFRSPPGLRGEPKVPSDRFAGLMQSLAAIAAPVLRRNPPPDGYTSASILVNVTGTSVSGGECRVDGVVSPELLHSVTQASWPAAVTSYMFKLFFAGVAPRG